MHIWLNGILVQIMADIEGLQQQHSYCSAAVGVEDAAAVRRRIARLVSFNICILIIKSTDILVLFYFFVEIDHSPNLELVDLAGPIFIQRFWFDSTRSTRIPPH
jgi:hypothetical protein